MKIHYKLIIILLASGLMFSCGTSQVYEPIKEVPTSLYRDMDISGKDTLNMAQINWKDFFLDTHLKELIQKGLNQNLDLKIGIERINSANALLRQTKANFLPAIEGGTSFKESRISENQSWGMAKNTTEYNLFTKLSWEVDIWGKLASSKRVAYYKVLQTNEVQQAIKTQLIAQIANYYYQLITLDKQQLILEQTIVNRALDIKTMLHLKESNVVTAAAVVQSEANYYMAQADLPKVKREIRAIENALSILIGQTAGVIPRGSFDQQQLEMNFQIGFPIQLLANRPDVKAAEMEVASYFEEVNVARRAFYPSLTLSAGIGYSGSEFKELFTASGFFANIAGGIIQPIFNKRLNKTKLEIAKAVYQEKVFNFQKTLLIAGQEVSDALYSVQTAKNQEENRLLQIEKLNLAVEYTKKLLLYHSSTNYTDVLTSEQAYLTAQIQMTIDRLLKWQSIIELYRSLGGGAHLSDI